MIESIVEGRRTWYAGRAVAEMEALLCVAL